MAWCGCEIDDGVERGIALPLFVNLGLWWCVGGFEIDRPCLVCEGLRFGSLREGGGLAMDGNKDEGLRCMKIGKAAMESGDKVRAVKFLNMAKRMYPNPQVDSLLREMAEGEYEPSADKNSDRDSGRAGSTNGGGEDGEEVEETSHGRANGVHRSRSSTFGGAAEANANGNGNNKMPRSRSTPSVSEATPEQIEVVRRIRRTKDYYEILGLVKTCSEGEVRKAYRKISLKVHPDKNSAPGAEEAFKAVSKAFQVGHTRIRACLLSLYN